MQRDIEPARYEQASTVDRHYHESVNPHSGPAATVLAVFLGLICFFLLIVGAVRAFNQVAQAGVILVYIALVLIPLLMLAAIGGLIWNRLHMARLAKRHAELDVEAKANQMRNESQRAEAEAQYILAMAENLVSTVTWDEQGNAARFDPVTRQVIQLQGQMRLYPALSSIHYSFKQDGAKDQPLLPPGSVGKPTIEEIVSQLAPNGYKFSLGRSLNSGELIIAELPDAHLKLIGGTRMGKSCAAAAIIEQLRQTHDRNHLLLALLDLEHKTSRLFADDPQIMIVDTGYQRVKMHAKTIAQVAEYLIFLHDMMAWRYTLTDAQLNALPAVLIYLEEFLYWKRMLAQHVTPSIREKALASFTGIATRGLKAKMHLMACAQVDFRDEDLVEAMNQFIGINIAFSVKPSAAQAAGFVSSELLKQNYAARTPGQFVVEMIGGSDIGVAPNFDVRMKLASLDSGTDEPQAVFSELPTPVLAEHAELQTNLRRTAGRIEIDPSLQAKLAEVMENTGENMNATIKRVWGASPGDNTKYKQAKAEYMQIQEHIHAMARRSMEGA